MAAVLTALVCVGTYSIYNVIPDFKEKIINQDPNQNIGELPYDTTVPSENKPNDPIPSEESTQASETAYKTTEPPVSAAVPDNSTEYTENTATSSVKDNAVTVKGTNTAVTSKPSATTATSKNDINIHTTVPAMVDGSYGSAPVTGSSVKTTTAVTSYTHTATSVIYTDPPQYSPTAPPDGSTEISPSEPPDGSNEPPNHEPAETPGYDPVVTTAASIMPEPVLTTTKKTQLTDGDNTPPMTATTKFDTTRPSTTTKIYETTATNPYLTLPTYTEIATTYIEYETTTTTTTTAVPNTEHTETETAKTIYTTVYIPSRRKLSKIK